MLFLLSPRPTTLSFLSLHCCASHRYLHSFPTRRSSDLSLPPGDGPRHFHFHPNGRWLYSVQEEGSTVVLFDYDATDRKSTRLNSSHTVISYAVFCLKKKKPIRNASRWRREKRKNRTQYR